MTPAPDTGRTAEEMADVLRGLRRDRDSWKELAAENAIAADRYSREAAHLRAESANLRDRVREAEGAAEAMRGDSGRAAYEARFAHASPRDVEPWDSLPPEVKAIWARVAAACLAAVEGEGGDQ